MRILVPSDTATWFPYNPYVLQLIRSLTMNDPDDSVFYGARLLQWPAARFDIVHFQWPEAAVGWMPPSEAGFEEFRQNLLRLAGHAPIVTTVHNLDPHGEFGDMGELLFELIYSNTDHFVHLSEYSRDQFAKKYSSRPWCATARSSVIEHGEFSHYRQLPADHQLVRRLGLVGGDPVLLVFGAIRSVEEEELAREAFSRADLVGVKLLFAGLPSAKQLPPGTVQQWRSRQDNDIVRHHARVEDSEVAPLIKAAKFLFVSRIGRLNSGVISLAFTFDTPVIVPRDQALAPLATELGCPTYDPGDVGSAAEAIRRAYEMPEAEYTALKARIRAYRQEQMGWRAIAQQHHKIYTDERKINRKKSVYAALTSRAALVSLVVNAARLFKRKSKKLVKAIFG